MRKKALITGVTGQDGSYLAELLISKGYEVHGLIRRSSTSNTSRIADMDIQLHFSDLTETANLVDIMYTLNPDEIYALGAQSHVKISFEVPVYTADVTGIGTLRLLEAMRKACPKARFYQAGSSEQFGSAGYPQNEETLFQPESPYACAKIFAYNMVHVYRKAYGLFAANGLLFNHESERRGENFVTRKITRAATRIKLGLQEKLTLGNIDAYRDWGHSKDYCIDLDTKILTNNGFKTRNEISIGDNIINYNLQTDKWENDIIDDIYDIEYEGEMYTFNGNGFSFRASKNHRILYQTKTKDSHHWSNWKESTSSEIYEKFKDISLRTKFDYRFPGFTGIDSNGYDIEDNIITLLGYVVTEGCLYKSKTIGGGMTLSISQSNKKYLNDLIKCIDALNLTYNIYEREDGVYEIKFSSDSRNTILEYFDGYDVHTLPSYVYSFSQKQALLLFETMMNCDGCWSAMSYCSKKYKLAQQFSDIANYAGYRTKISQRKSGIYNVSVFSHAKKSVYQYVTDISKEQTSENIWCIKAKKNNTIITQKNKSTFISGNCRAMWMMLQHSEPDDFVVCSGESHSVREFLEIAFNKLDLDPYKYTEIDKSLFRPSEVDHLKGDCSKIKRILGWEPEISFDGLVTAMINHDMTLAQKELKMIGG